MGVDSGNGRLTETALTGWFVLSQRCELRIRSAQLATPVTSRAGWAARCWVSAGRPARAEKIQSRLSPLPQPAYGVSLFLSHRTAITWSTPPI